MSDQRAASVTANPATTALRSPFCIETEENPIKVNIKNATELKHTLDDAIKRILVLDHKFTESHTHTDRRLLLGYLSVIFAAYATAYSYYVPFPECKTVLTVCVAAYFALNGAMVAYIQFVERDTLFVGVRKDTLMGVNPDEKLTVKTETRASTAEYNITLQFANASTPAISSPAASVKTSTKKKSAAASTIPRAKKPKSEIVVKKSYGDFFDVEGTFVPQALVDALAKGIAAGGLKLE
ncbi:signal peptidase complex subunit 2 [Fimicolochytrium jonesii]|uniref:signal peptidase complex subunit 2 n=1 Tax=Fimicolochytrium jonesii TaxID=1396493 RepID=UPI0022FDBEBA|nr:signal peptidase complex subunit 2 [Fimicolochytrium jonesii]KAI8823043.1 signal peptidase complex subunit 2 [Fimicolochytrium jonesii]